MKTANGRATRNGSAKLQTTTTLNLKYPVPTYAEMKDTAMKKGYGKNVGEYLLELARRDIARPVKPVKITGTILKALTKRGVEVLGFTKAGKLAFIAHDGTSRDVTVIEACEWLARVTPLFATGKVHKDGSFLPDMEGSWSGKAQGKFFARIARLLPR